MYLMNKAEISNDWNQYKRLKGIKGKLFSGILGGVVGDALGVPVEFRQRDSYIITDMIGYGTYNQPPGTWSDDTSMTVCLIENIIEGNDLKGLMEKFLLYREEGYWTPFGKMFDIGRTTEEAITRYQGGSPITQCGGASELDNGNGALMRISPLAYTLKDIDQFQKRKGEVESVVEITHKHARSTLGSLIFIEFLIHLLHQENPLAAFDLAVTTICEELKKDDKYSREFSSYQRVFDKSIISVDRYQIKSDGYVVHSLEAALWCFFKHSNYHDAVLEAVNLGSDTDTIACLTGTIAGIHYGMDSIPEDWVAQLVKLEDLINLCERFYHVSSQR